MINVLLVTVGISMVFAQSPSPSHTHRPEGLDMIKAAPAAPYASLFQAEPQPDRQRFTLSPRAQDRRGHGRHQPPVERGQCGMPIIAANAAADPKMVVEIPRNTAAASKMRVVEMKDCRSEK